MKNIFRTAVNGIGAGILIAASLLPAFGAGQNYSASVSQGFNFRKDSQAMIGYINFLKIGGVELAADLDVTDPANIANHLKVSGVASAVQWDGDYSAPINFMAQVSAQNRSRLALLQSKVMADTGVDVQFTFYDYDSRTKAYHRCFHSGGVKLKGIMSRHGGEFSMKLSAEPGSEVASPVNYLLTLGAAPLAPAQKLYAAKAGAAKQVLPWGILIGGELPARAPAAQTAPTQKK